MDPERQESPLEQCQCSSVSATAKANPVIGDQPINEKILSNKTAQVCPMGLLIMQHPPSQEFSTKGGILWKPGRAASLPCTGQQHHPDQGKSNNSGLLYQNTEVVSSINPSCWVHHSLSCPWDNSSLLIKAELCPISFPANLPKPALEIKSISLNNEDFGSFVSAVERKLH